MFALVTKFNKTAIKVATNEVSSLNLLRENLKKKHELTGKRFTQATALKSSRFYFSRLRSKEKWKQFPSLANEKISQDLNDFVSEPSVCGLFLFIRRAISQQHFGWFHLIFGRLGQLSSKLVDYAIILTSVRSIVFHMHEKYGMKNI